MQSLHGECHVVAPSWQVCHFTPETANKLTASLYVDDVITGTKDEEEAYQLYLVSKSVLQEEVLACCPCDDQSPADETYTKAALVPSQPIGSGKQKILGVGWNVDND